MKIKLGVFTALFVIAHAGINGTTFFVIGDYGDVQNMAAANMMFDALDAVVGSTTNDTIDKPEFFIAAGDNIYPSNPTSPTSVEF